MALSEVVPDDNWDYDAVQQLMLADLNIKGRTPGKVIMQAPKDGFFYVLDRATGELIFRRAFLCRCRVDRPRASISRRAVP